MSEAKLCQKQDRCPLLLEAIHQKVTAESNMRLARAAAVEAETAFATKRTLFNEFYKLACACRKAKEELSWDSFRKVANGYLALSSMKTEY